MVIKDGYAHNLCNAKDFGLFYNICIFSNWNVVNEVEQMLCELPLLDFF